MSLGNYLPELLAENERSFRGLDDQRERELDESYERWRDHTLPSLSEIPEDPEPCQYSSQHSYRSPLAA